jgi:hypothetical protein
MRSFPVAITTPTKRMPAHMRRVITPSAWTRRLVHDSRVRRIDAEGKRVRIVPQRYKLLYHVRQRREARRAGKARAVKT